MKPLPIYWKLVFLLPMFWLAHAKAADHLNLDEGLPVQVEDAFPIDFRGRELQFTLRNEQTQDGQCKFTAEPRLEFGVARNMQLSVGSPFFFGDAPTTNSGNLSLGALYNFNQETVHVPAFALAGHIELPTGEHSQGMENSLKFIASKTIGQKHVDRLHLNLEWAHKCHRAEDEREDRYRAILGYSRRLCPDVLFVSNILREQELTQDHETNILEVGLRWALTPRTVLSFGGGPGLGEDSPDWRVTVGMQCSF